MKKFKITLVFICLLCTTNIFSQNYGVGCGIGIGSFHGNFQTQTTFGGKIFLDFPSFFQPFDFFRFNFSYAQQIDKFLPGNNNFDYFPYYLSLGLTGIFKQYLNKYIFIKEGIGAIILNDYSFYDIDTWNLGIKIAFEAGTEIAKNFDMSLNMDYGFTFTNTRSGYTQFSIKSVYNF